MNLGTVRQASTAVVRYIFDYSCKLDQNADLATVVAAITPVTDPLLVADNTILGASKQTGTIYISGGLPGGNYRVELTATTTDGEVWVDWFTLQIRDN